MTDAIRHVRLYWTARNGTRFSAEVPHPYAIVMPGAVCPICVNKERNCEVQDCDETVGTFRCMERAAGNGGYTHKIPKHALKVSTSGNSLVRVLDTSVEYIGKERNNVG
jgi:hypothetical protein